MDIQEHQQILTTVQRDLQQPFDPGDLPITGLRDHIRTHTHDNAFWFAISPLDELDNQQWCEAILPDLLGMGGSGPSDRMRAQVRILELLWDQQQDVQGLLYVSRDSAPYIALEGLVKEYVRRTQDSLRRQGFESMQLWRCGGIDELTATRNQARSWTSNPKGANSRGYLGDSLFTATVPVEHIAAFRGSGEQEVFVSWRSLAQRTADDPLPERLEVDVTPKRGLNGPSLPDTPSEASTAKRVRQNVPLTKAHSMLERFRKWISKHLPDDT